MVALTLDIATGPYDRVRAVQDGRAAIRDCSVRYTFSSPEDIFRQALEEHRYDVCEMSFSFYVRHFVQGSPHYIALPIFLSRLFRHSGIYIRTDRNISAPIDLRGRKIGVPNYLMTAAVWLRGILMDDYGVPIEGIDWRIGGLNRPQAKTKFPSNSPNGVRCSEIGADETLSALLESGAIDAIFSSQVPNCLQRRAPHVGRLFPDFQREEAAYFLRTGIHPIMHLLVVRRDLAEAHTWLPSEIYKAYSNAKSAAISEIECLSALSVTLPWAAAELERTKTLMGSDYWPYGIDGNKATINTFLRYLREQGLIDRTPNADDLFADVKVSSFGSGDHQLYETNHP